ncbi:hypothetical protein D4764_20G0005150 [Takifugu flavidus]|uniref:Uncharacterized protein n=1 Tax=Takifugu flavidus TaxID=433684 RepID=A0A5C6NGZ3_9TELE|nr:hypothetical protein D4764_20G0005150 [Takifugu flavidus]
MESVHEGSQGNESKGAKRAFGEETERMANEKFRRALRPVFRYGSIPLSELGPSAFFVLKMLHMNGLFPRMSVGSGPSCFLFLIDGFCDVIAAGLGLIPREMFYGIETCLERCFIPLMPASSLQPQQTKTKWSESCRHVVFGSVALGLSVWICCPCQSLRFIYS